MKMETKSYSAAVTSTSTKATLTPETMKKAVKDVVDNNDRSTKLMVLGFVEENLEGSVFEELARRKAPQ